MVGEMCVPGINGVCSYSLEVHSSADNFVPMMTEKNEIRLPLILEILSLSLWKVSSGFANCMQQSIWNEKHSRNQHDSRNQQRIEMNTKKN